MVEEVMILKEEAEKKIDKINLFIIENEDNYKKIENDQRLYKEIIKNDNIIKSSFRNINSIQNKISKMLNEKITEFDYYRICNLFHSKFLSKLKRKNTKLYEKTLLEIGLKKGERSYEDIE